MARLLLELYGRDVLFDTPEKIDRFLADADLLDKRYWRQVLLIARDLALPVDRLSLH
jgi:hypothetical protein